MNVTVGGPAPDFTLPTDGNGSVTLSSFRGRKVIVYFYPKDDTSGCTKEACAFRDALPDFSGTSAVVIGISRDPIGAHDKFKKKHDLNFILASDAESNVVEIYDAWVEKNMYGKKYMGIDRCTFLIDGNGLVQGIWHKVKVTGHVEAVLKAAQAI